jgi:hypothetical protein
VIVTREQPQEIADVGGEAARLVLRASLQQCDCLSSLRGAHLRVLSGVRVPDQRVHPARRAQRGEVREWRKELPELRRLTGSGPDAVAGALQELRDPPIALHFVHGYEGGE